MKFPFLFLSTIFILAILAYKALLFLYHFEQVNFIKQKETLPSNRSFRPKKILLVNSAHGAFGGAEMYSFSLYKNLEAAGHKVHMLIVKNSETEIFLQEHKISYYAYNKVMFLKNTIQPGLYTAIYKICKENNIQIIHCNGHREASAAKKVATKLDCKAILTRHISSPINLNHLNGLDGVISVNEETTNEMRRENKAKNLNIKEIIWIPPFFEEEQFLTFKPKSNKKDFFEKEFNIKIKDIPMLCMVASLNDNKNQILLIQAMDELINKKNIPFQTIFVGPCENSYTDKLKKLSSQLNIQDNVLFLGFTNKVADIVFHSDINVLTSKQEAFGIALLEAALLKKPLLGATNTGMTKIIKHEQTGLLFENNNAQSLADQIEKLLNNPDLCKILGENAYKHVKDNFSTQASMKKLENFYNKVLTN